MKNNELNDNLRAESSIILYCEVRNNMREELNENVINALTELWNNTELRQELYFELGIELRNELEELMQ